MRIAAGGSDPLAKAEPQARRKHLSLTVTFSARCLLRAAAIRRPWGLTPPAILTIEKHISRIVEYSYEDKQHRTRKLQKL